MVGVRTVCRRRCYVYVDFDINSKTGTCDKTELDLNGIKQTDTQSVIHAYPLFNPALDL